MKKIFMVIALMAMLMLPFTSFSMTAMEDGDLSSVTGQAGVSINLDARIDLTADVVAWGDADGFGDGTAIANVGGAVANSGWVGLTDLAVSNLRIRADQTLLGAQFFEKNYTTSTTIMPEVGAFGAAVGGYIGAYNAAYGTTYPISEASPAGPAINAATFKAILKDYAHNPYTVTGFSNVVTLMQGENVGYYLSAMKIVGGDGGSITPFAPLTIDVATDNTYGTAITFVRIGTGSLQVTMDSMTADVRLGPDNGTYAGVPDFLYELGSLYVGDMSLRIGGGSYVDIFNDRGPRTQGVSIATSLVIKDFHIGTLAWGDRDGIDYPADYVTNRDDLRFDPDNPGYDTTVYPAQGWVGLKNLDIGRIEVAGRIDIDVATRTSDNWTFVQIGLGADSSSALSVSLTGLTATAALGSTPIGPDNPATPTIIEGLNQELGELYVSGGTVKVYGDLQIGARPDGTQGVTINLAQLSVDISTGLTVSWGDLDGIATAGYTAGYVGLKNLSLVGLALSGQVTIDVATVADVADYDADITSMMYGNSGTGATFDGYVGHNMSPTFVHIGLGTGDANDAIGTDALGIAIESMTASVAFANNAALAAVGSNPGIIGSLYLSGINIGINGWIDIAAH